jgi:hypothetical protein
MKTHRVAHAFGMLGLASLALVACEKKTPAPAASASAAASSAPSSSYGLVDRMTFNRRAAELDLPLFWRSDANGDKAIDEAELAVLFRHEPAPRTDWVDPEGHFTKKFSLAYGQIAKPLSLSEVPEGDRKRLEAVALELSQGRPTLLESDFSKAPTEHRAFVKHMVAIAPMIERLHARQTGTLGQGEKVPHGDALSRALFFRNQGPFCEAPKTKNDPNCNALAARPKRVVGLYPADIQSDPKFCAGLEREKNGKELMGHFSVVVSAAPAPGFKAVKYSEAWAEDMQAVAKALEAAAGILNDDEAALKKYLLADAAAFRTNDWETADEAWKAMTAENSKYYLRVAPDENYYDPCGWKAGFALTFARINADSLTWQQKFEPLKQDMEKAIAGLAGAPYKERTVGFKLPAFIDIVLNAGDSRAPLGGTAGQSLPNWGRVAEKGGRTVVMSNILTPSDTDARASSRSLQTSLLCSATSAKLPDSAKPEMMSVVLHEAAHNLGPSHDYKAGGKTDDDSFGGQLAATLEELKAQTSALYFPAWLAERNLITGENADTSRLRDVFWAFGQISRGMYDAAGKPENYAQLASVQLGYLMKTSVVEWKPTEPAANGTDKGCFEVHLEKWQPAITELEKIVLAIKAKGDKSAAQKLFAEHVDAKDAWAELRKTIAERMLRKPRASFVYSITE